MSSSTLFQIEIPKRDSVCAHGQEHLAPGMEFYSMLKEGAEEGIYIRQDYCLSCWEKILPQIASEVVRSTWKSKIPAKKEVSDLPKQRDARATVLLKQALSRHEQDDLAEAFVLALYLVRKRLLYFRQDLFLDDGREASIYEDAQTEEMLCVPKILLSSLQIEKIQSELAAKFKF